jgi:chemotaxis protein MotB
MGPLPPDIEADLQRLASEYPQLMTFDARRGMLRFSSDFSFALGSTELSQDAMTTLDVLADILNKSSAAGLEVRVVGHTDNVPIGKPETRQKHPTNLHLSVHRAIAVQDALVDQGVAATRIQVAGYGEYRPIVANGPKGAQANRRVEIFLAPMPNDMAIGVPSSASEVRVPDEPMK